MTLERLHSLNENSPNVVMTLQGRLANKSSGGACAILGMTLSRADLVFDRLFREKCSAMQGDSLVA